LPQRIFLAGYFGAFIWRVFMASKSSGFEGKARQKKRKVNFAYSMDL
jgi:hypothetical protein